MRLGRNDLVDVIWSGVLLSSSATRPVSKWWEDACKQKGSEGGAPERLETYSFLFPGHDSVAINFGRLAFLPGAPASCLLACLPLLECLLGVRHDDEHCRHRDNIVFGIC